jgi:hypothetical protein
MKLSEWVENKLTITRRGQAKQNVTKLNQYEFKHELMQYNKGHPAHN